MSGTNSHTRTTAPATILFDAVGLLALAPQAAVAVYWLAPAEEDHTILGILVYLVLAALALWLWHHDEYARSFATPTQCLGLAGGSICIGAISFAMDVLIGLIFHHGGATPLDAASKAGGPFGFVLTLLICPGLTAIAVAGFVRSLLKSQAA